MDKNLILSGAGKAVRIKGDSDPNMANIIRRKVRAISRRFGYAILDLHKDQATDLFVPGHLMKIFDRLKINCVIDVGANRGDYAATLRHFGYTGRVVSIEPLPDVYAQLRERAAGDPGWDTLNFAVGQKEEVRPLKVYASRPLSSFLSPVPGIDEIVLESEVTDVIPVTVKTIDAIFKDLVRGISDPRVFLKLDTQGCDLEVMKGSLASLKQVHGIQSEISVIPLYEGMPDYVQSLDFFYKLGFLPTGFFAVTGHRNTGRVIEFDVVLTRLADQPS
ncbi:MAG: FkbM family methyltransferase [Candidatus Korobacteraceae bacterium]